jgi:hypothetical protein
MSARRKRGWQVSADGYTARWHPAGPNSPRITISGPGIEDEVSYPAFKTGKDAIDQLNAALAFAARQYGKVVF